MVCGRRSPPDPRRNGLHAGWCRPLDSQPEMLITYSHQEFGKTNNFNKLSKIRRPALCNFGESGFSLIGVGANFFIKIHQNYQSLLKIITSVR